MTHRGNWCVVLLCCCSAVANLHLSFLLPSRFYFFLPLFPNLFFFPPLSLRSSLLFFRSRSAFFHSISGSVSLAALLILPSSLHFFCQPPSQVSECNWPSRQAPSLHNLFAVCKNMHNWLKQNPKNVCVITCSVRRCWHKQASSYSSLSNIRFW